MRISKFLCAICAVVVCANFISVRADDTPAQAAARAALEQKMQQLDAQQTVTNTETAPAVVAVPSGATQEQPAMPAPVPAATQPGAVPSPLDTNTMPTAETIRRSMMPLPGENQPAKSAPVAQAVQTPVTTPVQTETIPAPAPAEVAPVQTPAPVVIVPAETPVVATPPAETKPADVAPSAPETVPAATQTETAPTEVQQAAPASANTGNQDKALQALQQKMSELDKQPAVTPPPAVTEIRPAPDATVQVPAAPVAAPASKKSSDVNYPAKELGLTPISAPALPITAHKEARLQALLAKYKADQITPAEYQSQRAAILAEP